MPLALGRGERGGDFRSVADRFSPFDDGLLYRGKARLEARFPSCYRPRKGRIAYLYTPNILMV